MQGQSAFTNRKDLAECDRELITFRQQHSDQSRPWFNSAFSSKGLHKKQDSNVGVKETAHAIHDEQIGKSHRRMQSDPENKKTFLVSE